MSLKMIAQRAAAALGAALLLTSPALAQEARQDPAHCIGQPELKPLQPLSLQTSRGPQKFMVEFAATPKQRDFGLMCRKVLAPDRGMLFDFKKPQEVYFWMRNTLIPLDMVFIRADGRVVSIARNVQPLDETPVPGGGMVRGVLEIAGGRAAQIGLLPGDRVVHKIFPAS